MQRQLYPILLLIAGGSAVAVCLRPHMAEELTSLVRLWGPDAPSQAFAEPPTARTAPRWDASSGSTQGGIQSTATDRYSWPAGPQYSNAWSTTGDRQPVPAGPPMPPGPTQADLSEEPYAGYATAGDGRLAARPDATGMPRGNVDPYPVAGHRYSSAGGTDYRPSGDVGNRPRADSRLGFPEPNGMRYAEASPDYRPSAGSYFARERARLLEPSQPALPPHDGNLPRGENPPRAEAAAASPRKPDGGLCETAQTLARVGSDIILAGEVLPLIDKTMENNKDKIPQNQWEATRNALIQQAIESRVQFKLICADVKRSLPPEALEHVEGRIGEGFEEHEIPARLKKANLASRLELERELEKIGSSLEREKRMYVERSMALKWVDENVRNTKEITHDDMLDYYREHQKDFEHAGRARWEQLTMRFSRHPNKTEAFGALAKMGNEVLDGRPLADVAKEYSQGTTARSGGARDWITQGSLRSKELDLAIFALPVGKLSQIIEDEQGFHIIRVTEREDQSRTPFTEAQVQIKEKISQARRQRQFGEFTERLKSEIPVWTVFDDQTADSRSSETGKSPVR